MNDVTLIYVIFDLLALKIVPYQALYLEVGIAPCWPYSYNCMGMSGLNLFQ